MPTMSRTSIASMAWLRLWKRARDVLRERARDDRAAGAAIAIVIAGGAAEEDVQVAALGATVADIRAAAVDGDGGRISSQ